MAIPTNTPTYRPDEANRGTGFTNLQQYLNANQNNQLGNTISGGINNQIQNTQQGLNQANQQFQQGLESNAFNTPQNQTYVNQTLQNAQNIQPGQNVGQQDIGKFQQFLGGQYTGPQSLSNAQMLAGQAQNAQALGQSTLSEGGRQALLQQFAGKSNPYQSYSQGQQNLDSLLLGQQGKQLQGAAKQSNQLGQQVQNSITGAQQQAQTAQTGNQQFGKWVGDQTQGALNTYQQNINNAANAANQAAQNQLQSDYYSLESQYNPNIQLPAGAHVGFMARPGGQPQPLTSDLQFLQGQYSAGVTPQQIEQYITQGAQATAQNIATPQQQAQYNALAQLAGQANNFLPAGQQVGGYDPTKAITVNQAGINQLLQNALNNQTVGVPTWQSNGEIGGLVPVQQSLASQISQIPALQQYINNAKAGQWYQSYYQPQVNELNEIMSKLGPKFGG